MSTPPGWEPRPGPTRGDPARRAPRGPGGWARDDADPRRQGGRGGAAAGGRDWGSGPGFTPRRAPGPRDSGPGGPRAARGGQGRLPNSDGYDRRGPMPDDFAGRPRSPGKGRAQDRGVLTGGPSGPDGWRPGGVARWLGRMSTRTAVLVLFAGTLLGVIFTLAVGQEPGGLLGFFIIVGTIAAALGIRRGKVYLLFPAPALAFFLAAIVTGKVHDAKLGSSTAGLGAGFTQWIAGIFFPAVVATIVVLLVGGGRWLLGRQLVTGGSPQYAGRPAPGKGRPAPRDRRRLRRFLGRGRSLRQRRPALAQDRPNPQARHRANPWPGHRSNAEAGQCPPARRLERRPPAPPAAAPGRRPRPLGRPAPARRPQPAAHGPPPARKRPGPPRPPAARPQSPPVLEPQPKPQASPAPRPRGRLAPALTRKTSELFQWCVAQDQVLNAVRTSEVNLRFGAVPVPVG